MKKILLVFLFLPGILFSQADLLDDGYTQFLVKRFSLPANSAGYLYNDGSGGLSWGALDLSPYVRKDGTTELTADWNVGAFDLTAVDMTATGNITGNNLTASPTLAAESITFDETFDSPAPSGWSFDSTKWTHSTGTTALICDTMNPVVGTVYKCVMTVEWTSGTSLSFAISGTTTLYITSAGTYTCYIKATATTSPRFTPSTDFVGAVTSLSIKAVTNGEVENGAFTTTPYQILAPNGSATYPSYGFEQDTDAGIWLEKTSAATAIFLQPASTAYLKLTSANALFSGLNIMLGSTDLILNRDAAATLQLGGDSASASTNQTIKAHDRTGTDAAGANLTLLAGNSTGSGTGGSFFVGTTPAGSAGTDVNAAVNRLEVNSAGDVKHLGANSQATNIQQATAVVTTTAAATATATNLIPAGSMVIGVTCRNITAITGDAGFTGYNIGDGSDPDRWGANVNPAINETTDLTDITIASPVYYTTATSVVLTQIGGTTFIAGKTIRVTVHYVSLTAPNT